jgi:hypothetical protein
LQKTFTIFLLPDFIEKKVNRDLKLDMNFGEIDKLWEKLLKEIKGIKEKNKIMKE